MQTAVTIDDMKAEIRRELAMRRKVYSRWVDNGTMVEADAGRQVARLSAALQLIEELQESQQEIPPRFLRLRTMEVFI
jgi:hypothetical protein